MKKYLVVLPVAALVFSAACSDSAQNPLAVSQSGPSMTASHSSIPAPVVTAGAVGKEVTVSWNWSDAEGWDLVSFTVKRDGSKLDVAIPNAKPYAAGAVLPREITDEVELDGSYEYCVEVMAKHQPNGSGTTPTLTHHSSACRTVEVGQTHTFAVTVTNRGGKGGDVSIAVEKNANTWNVEFQLSHNDAPVNCAAAPSELTAVAASLVYGSPTSTLGATVSCNSDPVSTGYGRYTAQFRNPAKDSVITGTVEFGVTYGGKEYSAGSRQLASS